jgi:hypothetical protein
MKYKIRQENEQNKERDKIIQYFPQVFILIQNIGWNSKQRKIGGKMGIEIQRQTNNQNIFHTWHAQQVTFIKWV